MHYPADTFNNHLNAFLSVSTWQEGKNMVEVQGNILLNPQLDDILDSRIWDAVSREEQWQVMNLQISRRILDTCRKRGIESGFQNWLTPTSPNEKNSLYEQYMLLNSNEDRLKFRVNFPEIELDFFHFRSAAIPVNLGLFGDLPYQMNMLKKELDQTNPLDDTFKWAYVRNYLGKMMALSDMPGRVERLEDAVQLWKLVLEVLQTNFVGEGMLWAEVQVNLAMAFTDNRYPGIRFKNFDLALACIDEAFRIYNRKFTPLEWAITQSKLSHLYMEHPSQNLSKAVQHMEAAISVLKYCSDNPLLLAKNMGDLGTYYLAYNSGNIAENIEKAISCFEEALKSFKEQDSIDDMKLLYRNLSDAYRKRVNGSASENLNIARRYLTMASTN